MCELSDKLLDMADPRNMQPVSSYVMTLNQAADEIDARAATIEALEKRLEEVIENELWSAFATGTVQGDKWSHMGMSDGEGLCNALELDFQLMWHDAAEMKAAIPKAAKRLAKEPTQ